MKIRKKRTAKKLLSLLLAAIVSVTFTPVFDFGAFAADEGLPAGADEELKYIEKLPGGGERELDPEIFEDGAVINDEMIEELGLDTEPEPTGEEVEQIDASPAGSFDIPSMAAAGMAFPEALEDIPDEDSAADGDEAMPEEASGLEEQGEPKEESVEAGDPAEPEGGEEITPPDEAEEEAITEDTPAGDVVDENAFTPEADGDIIGGAAYNMSSNGNIFKMAASPTVSFNSSMNYSTGIVHVTASISSGYYISNCVVMNLTTNDVVYRENRTSGRSYTKDIDMKSCPIGIYVVGVYYRNTGNTIEATLLDMGQFAVSVYLTPSQSGRFEVYSNYISYMAPVFDYAAVSAYKLFMDCGPKVGFGPMNYVQNYTIPGLAPNTNYATKVYYGTSKYVTHYVNKNGSLVLANDTIFFSGKDTGRVRGTGTYRTGMAKLPKIKSIKVKAVKVKKRKAGVYGWYTGYYFGSVKYYTYKIKVTVKFKKKPGTPGIYLNGVYRGGNKKTYSKTFGTYAAYSKPRGKKFVVTLYSSQNPSYGGYSPFYAKKKKVS